MWFAYYEVMKEKIALPIMITDNGFFSVLSVIYIGGKQLEVSSEHLFKQLFEDFRVQ